MDVIIEYTSLFEREKIQKNFSFKQLEYIDKIEKIVRKSPLFTSKLSIYPN